MSMEVPSSSVEGERNPLRSNTLDENSWWIGIIPGWEQPMEPIIPTFQHCFAWVRACRISMNFSTWFMLGWVGGFNCPENSWTILNIYQLYSRWRSETTSTSFRSKPRSVSPVLLIAVAGCCKRCAPTRHVWNVRAIHWSWPSKIWGAV
jgi:hypothetical protein